MEKINEHLEHIEHTQHAAHSAFDRNVAMTMAIVAAVLACVTMLSHRAHNRTLALKSDAIRHQTQASIELSAANALQTESNVFHTRAADQWAFFQAKNIRQHEYEAYLKLMGALAKDPQGEKDRAEAVAYWQKQLAKYETELPKMQLDARKLEKEAEALMERAKQKQEEATRHQESAEAALEQSEHTHHRGDRLDLSELAVELALVLCSIAVLTKRGGFWYSGIASGVVGAAIAAWAFLAH